VAECFSIKQVAFLKLKLKIK